MPALTSLVYHQQRIVQQEEVTQLEQCWRWAKQHVLLWARTAGCHKHFVSSQEEKDIGNTINTLDIRFLALADVHKLTFQTLRKAFCLDPRGLGSRASAVALGYGTTGLERLCLSPSSIHCDSAALLTNGPFSLKPVILLESWSRN